MSDEVFLGLGGTVDFELAWDEQVMQRLIDRHGVCSADLKEPRQIIAEKDIIISVLRAISANAGLECPVLDGRVLIDFAQHFSYRVTLGGTGVRAALALSTLGVASKVHLVSISEEVRRLLPSEVAWVCSAQEDTVDPHVIVQYPKGCALHLSDGVTVRAQRPNRVILVNDPPNERMVLVEDFRQHCEAARVIVISGFNAMSDGELLAERLRQIEQALACKTAERIVLFEDAGYHDDALRAQVIKSVNTWANIFSLNEDEAQFYAQKRVDFEDAEQLCELFRTLHSVVSVPNIVLHTAHYAAVSGEDLERTFAAAQSGCQMASTRFAYGDTFSPDDFGMTARAPLNPIGQKLAADPALELCGIKIAPAYDIPATSPTTIGLGDSFVAGMVLSLTRWVERKSAHWRV